MSDAHRSILAMLVMDLGYRKCPRYGHAPMRHMFAWREVEKAVSPEELTAEIERMIGHDDEERT